MTVGKVTKKESRIFGRTYNFMKKTDNLTFRDFAELIEFMHQSNVRENNDGGGQQAATPRQVIKPALGSGNFLSQRIQAGRAQAQAATPNNARQRAAIPPARRIPDWPVPDSYIDENGVRVPRQPPGGRVKVEYAQQYLNFDYPPKYSF